MTQADLDIRALDAHLSQHLPDYRGPLEASKFPGGQSNPTFLLTTPERRLVLRRKPPGILLKSAHAVDREFRVLHALAKTDVPVPRVHHLCEDDSVIGSAFFVMEYLEGKVFWDPALPELSPAQRGQVYDEMNRVLAAIHSVDLDAVGLADYGRPGNYFSRQFSRWSDQYLTAQPERIPEMDALLDWLPAHMPADDGWSTLIHGDYRIDNIMFDADSLRVIGVFDWELSTLGHPMADLAFHLLQRRMEPGWPIKGLAGLDLQRLGIPSEDSYLADYCRRMNLDRIDNWSFYLAFAFFRFAAICLGIRQRHRQGNASSDQASGVASLAEPFARLGWGCAQS